MSNKYSKRISLLVLSMVSIVLTYAVVMSVVGWETRLGSLVSTIALIVLGILTISVFVISFMYLLRGKRETRKEYLERQLNAGAVYNMIIYPFCFWHSWWGVQSGYGFSIYFVLLAVTFLVSLLLRSHWKKMLKRIGSESE